MQSSMVPLMILVRVCIWVLGQPRGFWSAHGLPQVFLSGLWLSYYALVAVCLMQSMSCMQWMERKGSMAFSLESKHDFYM